jgi:phosphopantothenoylcysteine synthetase/decarboxylase
VAAIDTAMWKHPITKQHIKPLEGEWGVKNRGWIEVLKSVEKELVCRDTRVGAMKDWKDIVYVIEALKRADLVLPRLPKNWLSSSQDITSAYHNIFKSITRVRVRELTRD